MKEHVTLKGPARATKYTHNEVVAVEQIDQTDTKSTRHRINGFLLLTVKFDSFGQWHWGMIPKNNPTDLL